MSEIERILIAKEKVNRKKSYLSKIWKKIKTSLSIVFPKIYEIKVNLKKKNTFSGWGMTTNTTSPPWKNLNLKENLFFNKIHKKLIQKVTNKDFKLTQFHYDDANYQKILDECQWRHYIVFNSVLETLKFVEDKEVNLVECGVCDGLTINYAMQACDLKTVKYKSYLYDAWENLDSTNKDLRFNYEYLDIETTKINLKEFSNNIVYNKGFIPQVFKVSNNPEKIHWLHIDLNSNEATKDSLEFFYNKIVNNGSILFDDYGGFEDTRKIIDDFFSNKNGHFINFPTGQGIFYKKN